MLSDPNKRKAECCTPFQEVISDVFWQDLLEVTVDRSRGRKPGRKTDQWIQPADSVALEAIWLRFKSAGGMDPDNWYSVAGWNPDDERNPQGDAWGYP